MSPKKTEKEIEGPEIETQEPRPCLVLSNGDIMPVTQGDLNRLLQRMNQGGVIEGAYALDSGITVVLSHVMLVSPDAAMVR